MFNFFKKKKQEDVPTLKNGTPKSFDYFSFSLKTDLPKQDLSHETKNVEISLDDDGELRVYYKKKLIGCADSVARKKFEENCLNKKCEIHSFVVYEGGRAKVRIKYFY